MQKLLPGFDRAGGAGFIGNGTSTANNGRDANGRTIPGINANGTSTAPAQTAVTPVSPPRK